MKEIRNYKRPWLWRWVVEVINNRFDELSFKILRNDEGCYLMIKKYRLNLLPYWFLMYEEPMDFDDCLECIMEYCCCSNKGRAIIYDREGANPKMVIKYRRFSGERLDEFTIVRYNKMWSDS